MQTPELHVLRILHQVCDGRSQACTGPGAAGRLSLQHPHSDQSSLESRKMSGAGRVALAGLRLYFWQATGAHGVRLRCGFQVPQPQEKRCSCGPGVGDKQLLLLRHPGEGLGSLACHRPR